jgi:hypothetical protein
MTARSATRRTVLAPSADRDAKEPNAKIQMMALVGRTMHANAANAMHFRRRVLWFDDENEVIWAKDNIPLIVMKGPREVAEGQGRESRFGRVRQRSGEGKGMKERRHGQDELVNGDEQS